MTVLVSGLAVKRITALTLASGKLPIGKAPLDPDEPFDEVLCELDPAAAPFET